MAAADTPAPLPPEIALVVRRQRGAVRTLRAEGVILPLLLLALMIGTIALDGGVRTPVAVLLALVPIPLVAAVLVRLDRFEPEPARLLLRTFLWGAGAATFVALIINTLVGAVAGDAVATVVSAPVVEETAKALALVFVLRKRPGFLDGVHDGIVYAAWVALGFASVENILYYLQAWADEGVGGMTATFALRGLMLPLCHPIFTSMTGIGIGIAVSRHWGRGGLIAGFLGGLAVAIALHALWNGSTIFGGTEVVILLGYLPLAVIGILLLIGGARRERRILRKGLQPELERGTIDEAEYALLTGGGRVRARLHRRARKAGREARLMVYQYEASAYELAHANAQGRRRERPDPEASKAAFRGCLAEAQSRLRGEWPGVIPA